MAGLKNILIGVFFLIAFAIIIFILLFLHPSVGDSGHMFVVRFTDIDKVNVGTRVTYAGLPVGEVVKIEEIPNARTNRLDYNGDVYVYQLTLRVDSSVNIYSTDSIAVRTSGLLGERNIEISPAPLKPGEELILINNDILYADPTPSVEDTLKKFGSLSKKFETVLDGFSDMITDFNQERIIEKLAHSMQNIVEITKTLNQPEKLNQTIDNILTISDSIKNSWETVDSSFKNFHGLTERAHETWTTIDRAVHQVDDLTVRAHQSWNSVDETLHKFNTAANNTQEFTNTINHVLADTARGKGTIGRLFVNDELYLRLKSILHKGETVANDINRYGVLFQNNKSWQRLNARRQNLLGRLNNPQKFTNHFTDEMDRISTSLSNVTMVLGETPHYPNGLMCNPQFVTRFSELIHRVEDVEEALKMYNEQIIDEGCLSPSPQ